MRHHATVVFSTYNRAHLLQRSIEAYNRLRFPLDKLEVIVIDDGSYDATAEVCKTFDHRIDVKYIYLRKPVDLWRDCAATLNIGLRCANGNIIVVAHPEMMPGRDTITDICDNAKDNIWVSCRAYYLRPIDQDNIDTVDWRNNGLLETRKLPGFYDPHPGNPHYHPSAIDTIGNPGGIAPTWESLVYAGCNRRLWSILGGFHETPVWGAIDLLQCQRRHRLGIKCITPLNPESICIHQNHDSNVGVYKVTDRDINAAHANAPVLNVDQCKAPYVDGIGWGII